MKAVLTIMAVVVGALTATSAAHAQAACPPGKVAVPHARGGTVCIVPSKSSGDCVAPRFHAGRPGRFQEPVRLRSARTKPAQRLS